MSRFMLLSGLGLSALAVCLVGTLGQESHPTGKSEGKGPDGDKFCVTMWPETTRVEIKRSFVVILRVVNSTEKTQSFDIMSSSWFEHWTTDNKRITWIRWSSSRNFPVTQTLEPGEACEFKLQVLVERGPPLVITSFRMGFTPIGEEKTYWSNKVVLGIKPRKRE